ncbi:hypothetical protein QPM17_20540 [Marinobacter sp. TBZ242]|uniref:Uncharacterized protein n=1 Tax=Marinobacter azerbaijanicus TaxID=3050455 RepID=A0ABT7IH78_9GAMM|nr:hypothetical protein [Marinobacter sp. TBZ242]MDL0433537.1 hypothetical protein [Marinobacter sp. TBZ242]
MLQQTDTTRIHRLTVRGPSGTRQRLLPQLESSHWPAPADGSWVLVRRVAASAGKSRLASELLEKARQQIDSGDPSEVVRFPSLAALVAALVTDISRGVASQHWYWQRWSRLWPLPAGDAIQQLMQEHPRQLVPICHILASEGNLIDVWRCLSADNGAAVMSALCYELGLAQHTLDPAPAATITDRPGMVISFDQSHSWQPIFASLPDTDARSRLAALIVATDSAALALRAAPARTLATVQQRMAQTRRDRAATSTSTPDTPPQPDAGRFEESAPQTGLGTGHSQVTGRGNESLPQAASDSGALHTGPGSPKTVERAGPGTVHRSASPEPVETAAVDPYPPGQEANSRSGRLRTNMGGVLYLLNVLNRPPIQAIMEQAWQLLPNGWAWLYRLARELDLDPDDALCDFLAQRLGLESVAELESLPQLPERQTLVSLAAQWFSHAELWTPTLIRVPAELVHTPGHLDMYMDNSQVRLELRLAGLDLNPGWLPWLGTVVTFHFDHFPHLQGTTS